MLVKAGARIESADKYANAIILNIIIILNDLFSFFFFC